MNILLSGNLHWFYPKIPKEKQTFQKNIIAHPIVINQIPVFIKKVLNPAGFKLFLLKNGCWSNENPFSGRNVYLAKHSSTLIFMLKSMTGFGRAEQTVNEKAFLVEIKSLNGKQFEINLKIPPVLKSYEFDVRAMLQERLIRGSIDCLITIKQNGSAKPVVVNTDLIKAYYRQIAILADELGIDTNAVLSALLRLPEVITPSNEILAENDWAELKKVVEAALNELDDHRCEEGKSIETELNLRIKNINAQEEEILRLEPLRKLRMKDELVRMLEENVGKENYDPNRLEQELIFYIEKLDITEEQVRLKNHCEYFTSILNDHEESKGKKLSFVLQEIGREINTTGSKAYDAAIQKCVVLMKDELEKLKEQILNVL